MLKSVKLAKYGLNTIHNLPTWPHKNDLAILMTEGERMLKAHFMLFYAKFKLVQFKKHYMMRRIFKQYTAQFKIIYVCYFLHGFCPNFF